MERLIKVKLCFRRLVFAGVSPMNSRKLCSFPLDKTALSRRVAHKAPLVALEPPLAASPFSFPASRRVSEK